MVRATASENASSFGFGLHGKPPQEVLGGGDTRGEVVPLSALIRLRDRTRSCPGGAHGQENPSQGNKRLSLCQWINLYSYFSYIKYSKL